MVCVRPEPKDDCLKSLLTIATRWGYVSEHDEKTALALLDEVAAMTHTMLRPRR